MYLKEKDQVLERINKSIIKEKEVENLRPSTLWFYRGIVILSLAVIVVCMYVIGSLCYREMKLIHNHNKIEVKLQEQIDSLTKQLEDAENTINEQEARVKELEMMIETVSEAITQLQNENEELEVQLKTKESENLSLSAELESLNKAHEELNGKYELLAQREELYDKYEYALMYNSERTELTYDMCAYGEKLMLNYYLDPDLLFSIGMTESEYTEDAKNPDSTATGFHQFLEGTGEWVYESLGYTDEYNHTEVQTNGYRSIECAAWYLNYLYNKHDGDIMKVIEGYRGIENPTSYINRINTFLAVKDKKLDDVDKFIESLYDEAVG